MQDQFPVGAPDPMASLLMQLAPTVLIQIPIVILTWRICRKRGVSPWGWTVAVAIPVVGTFVWGLAFIPSSIMAVFDRLNALEDKSTAR